MACELKWLVLYLNLKLEHPEMYGKKVHDISHMMMMSRYVSYWWRHYLQQNALGYCIRCPQAQSFSISPFPQSDLGRLDRALLEEQLYDKINTWKYKYMWPVEWHHGCNVMNFFITRERADVQEAQASYDGGYKEDINGLVASILWRH